jgi:hypothetical protein
MAAMAGPISRLNINCRDIWQQLQNFDVKLKQYRTEILFEI